MAGRIAYYGNISPQGLVLNLDAAIVGSYPKTGSTWFDISNNGNNGTLTNGPTFTGSDYGAIVFDGSNDFINVTNSNSINFSTNDFGCSTWLFVNSGSLIQYREYGTVNKSAGASDKPGWAIEYLTWGYSPPFDQIGVLAFNASQSYWGNTSVYGTIKTQKWNNVILTRTNGIFDLYINGSPIARNSHPQVALNVSNSVDLTLGKSQTWQSYYKGQIADVQLYNQTFTQFQIWQNFNAYKSRYGIPDIVTDGLVLNLDAGNPYSYLSGSSGTTWTDVSGEGNNGTLTNGPVYSNGAITFDGSDDYVAEPYTSLLSLGTQFSISSFVRLGNTSQTVQPIFSTHDVNFNITTQGYNLYWYKDANFGISGSTVRFQFGQSAWQWNVYGSNGNAIIDTNWHYVCVTATSLNTNNPTINFYVDGVNAGSNYWNASPKGAILYSSNTGSVRVGSTYYPSRPTYDGPYYFTGNISSTKIYNRALTQEEITQNFNALRGRYGI